MEAQSTTYYHHTIKCRKKQKTTEQNDAYQNHEMYKSLTCESMWTKHKHIVRFSNTGRLVWGQLRRIINLLSSLRSKHPLANVTALKKQPVLCHPSSLQYLHSTLCIYPLNTTLIKQHHRHLQHKLFLESISPPPSVVGQKKTCNICETNVMTQTITDPNHQTETIYRVFRKTNQTQFLGWQETSAIVLELNFMIHRNCII